MKKEVPLIITFLAGFLLILAFFIPHRPFGRIEEIFNDWFIIVSGFTLIIGIDSLLAYNFNKIRRGEKDAPYALVTILAFFLTLIWGLVEIIRTPEKNPLAPSSTFAQYFYNYIFIPLQATMFAILSFFVASAAYRAFRAKEINSALLLFAAILVMLGRIPIGNSWAPIIITVIFVIFAVYFLVESMGITDPATKALYVLVAIIFLALIYPLGFVYFKKHIPEFADWLMNVPQLAGKRGMMIGIALGQIAMSIRIILGIERTYLK
ncbi:MAG: hypothetical protein ABIM31_05990 [candidate division WOR-3 bacterium]